MKEAMETMRLSLRRMCSKESAMAVVLSSEVPVGRYISTANWLRSAVGIIFCGRMVMSTAPANTDTTAVPTTP